MASTVANDSGTEADQLDLSDHIFVAVGKLSSQMAILTDAARKERQEASLTRLQNITRHLPGFIYEFKVNADGSRCFPYVSESIEKHFGISCEEVSSNVQKVWDRIHPDDVARVEASTAASASSGELWTCEFRIVRPDGSVRWFSGSAKPESQPDGSTLWYGYVDDITDRHKVEETLRKKTALLQLLTETALNFISVPVTKADTAIEHALGEIAVFFSADRAYLFEYNFQQEKTFNTHEWCAPGITPFKERLQGTPIEWDSEWYFKHQRGEVVHIPDVPAMPECSVKEILSMQSIQSVLTVPLMHEDKPIGFVGFDLVQTKRRFSEEEILLLGVFSRALVSVILRSEADQALKESYEQIDMFFDVSAGLLCVCDYEGQFLQVNHGWELFLGLPKSEIHGRSFATFVHPKDRRATEAMMLKLKQDKKVEDFVNRFVDKEGNWRSVSWVALSRNGKIYASARDVTAEREASEALKTALEDAEHMAEMRSRLISMASHEFRTPLSSIRLSTEMLETYLSDNGVPLPNSASKQFARIFSSTDQLTDVITDILEIEGVGRDKDTNLRTRVDLEALCEEVITTCGELHGASKRIHLTTQSPLVDFETNMLMLKSSLSNLLDNAIKYTSANSMIEVRLAQSGTYMSVEVLDQGDGIPDEEAANLFEAFFRSSRTSHLRGTGLGLPIVKRNIESLGGCVTYRPNQPKGSIFTITLPLEQNCTT